MDETTRETFDSWLAAYGRAWETRDPRAAASLFSENATYQETPFDQPTHGRSSIAEYWSRVTSGQEQVRFDHEVLAVDDETCIARWWATFYSVRSGGPVELDGIFVVRLAPNGTCTEFREWWHVRERQG